MKKFRVFTEVVVIVEKEIEASDFDDAYDKMTETAITNADIAEGERAREVITMAEDLSSGEYYDYNN
jgi:hypothetical protein